MTGQGKEKRGATSQNQSLMIAGISGEGLNFDAPVARLALSLVHEEPRLEEKRSQWPYISYCYVRDRKKKKRGGFSGGTRRRH